MTEFFKNLLTLLIGILITFFASSCTVVEGIFKIGMGFGIFLVIAVVVIIFLIIRRINKE